MWSEPTDEMCETSGGIAFGDGSPENNTARHSAKRMSQKAKAQNIKERTGKMAKKIAALVLSAATAVSGMAIGVSSANAATVPTTSYDRTLGNSTFETARKNYGLAQEMSYGSILHAWMWSFNTIKNNMEDIAKAGYTSIQTVPISEIKGPVEGTKFTENWYYVYQPTGTKIGNAVVGTEDDLKAMCAEAHKYGIRVIVDGVINHFSSDWSAIDPDWQDTSLFHSRNGICSGSNGDNIDYSNRWQVTQCHLLGLWDLNTQSQTVADRMASYLKQAVADGVDGFRYDAAKHIELPNEFDTYSPYYDTILPNGAQYQYGEVLQGDSGLNAAAYPALFDKYSSNGGGNTASNYGKAVRSAIGSGRLNAASLRNLQGDGVNDDQLVTWVESHDTYANGDKESTSLNSYQIRMGWAIIGARAGGAPLFFNRPVGSGGDNPQFSEQTKLGDKGDDEWKSAEVVAVNHFRNAMEGAPENLQNCKDNTSCLMIERGISDDTSDNNGVVIANMGGQQDLSGQSTTLDDGTYKDQVNGNTITVSNGTITSGYATGYKVSVFWNATGGSTVDSESISASPINTTFTGNGIEVTLRAQNATNLQWSTSDGKSGTFVTGDKITVGANAEVGDTITLTLTGTGTGSEGKSFNLKYTYTKVERAAQNLASYYSTNTTGATTKKTITVDGNVSDWDSSMLIAQGAANDDPRVYRENSMYEVPIDLYALYGTYDDDNLYLMWEMTNVQDYVDPGDTYPIGRPLYGELNCPLWIVLDTGRSDNKIGKNLNLTTGGTIWASNNQWEQSINNLVAISYNGANGPWMYGGDEDGLNSNAIYGPGANAATNTEKTGMKFAYGKGIKSTEVWGIDGGWGENNGRVVGDMTNQNANWVNFNSKGHDSAGQDSNYELSIPLSELGITAEDVASTGVGVQVVATMGLSGMDSLPYDLAANDNADLPDTTSQPNNSYEKSDDDSYSVPLARIGAAGGVVEQIPVESVTVSGSSSIDLGSSRYAQLSATVAPSNASNKKVTWSSSNETIATVDSKGKVTANKAGTVTITAKASNGVTGTIKITVTGELVLPTTTTVYYPSTVYGASSTYLHYRLGTGTWTTVPGVQMTAACDGYLSYTIDNPDQLQVEFVFNNGSGTWDNNGGNNYTATGESVLVKNGAVTVDAPPCTVDVPVTSVSLSPSSASVAVGSSTQLSASVSPSNATDKTVTWSSSNTAVATVDSSGKVTGVKAGTATITAKAGSKSATATVTVTASSVAVTGVTVSPSSLSLAKGATGQLSATVSPSNATDKTVTWRSSNTAVATVDANGKVTAVKAGTAAITATAGGVTSSAVAVTVTDSSVVEVTGVKVTSPSSKKLSIVETASQTVTASVQPTNATNQKIDWSSTNASVARVSSDGVVTGMKAGTANIIASANGHCDIIEVTVTALRFSDVPASHWFYDDIEWLGANGISTGNNGKFNPSDSTTRAETVLFLYRLAVKEGDMSAITYSPTAAEYQKFPDVNENSFAAKAILWAASKGITTGRSSGKFEGSATVTRAEMAMFMNRFARMRGDSAAATFTASASDLKKFSDVDGTGFANREILWGAANGIINGNNGKFSGNDDVLREQTAAFLHRLDTYLNK